MAIGLGRLVTRSQRRSSAGLANPIALRKLGTRNGPCLHRFLSLKAPPLAAGLFYWRTPMRFVHKGWGKRRVLVGERVLPAELEHHACWGSRGKIAEGEATQGSIEGA